MAEALDSLPPALLEGLDAGVLVVEQARRHSRGLPGVYILGEYVEDPQGLGRYVVLYYGSFRAILGNAEVEEVRQEIERTLAHELRHHLESRAGVDDLEEEDFRQLQAMREKQAMRRRPWRLRRRGRAAPGERS